MRIMNFNKCQEEIGNPAKMTQEFVLGLSMVIFRFIDKPDVELNSSTVWITDLKDYRISQILFIII
jgi:hypothetical protein